VSHEQQAAPATSPNALSQIRVRVAQSRVTWTGPLLLITGTSALMLLAQALVAAVFFLQGSLEPWLAAGPWWTIYGTLVDLGCLALMWKFTRSEGITLRDLVGYIRLQYGRDFFRGIGIFALVFPLLVGAGLLSGRWLYSTFHAEPYPGLLSRRVLPLWALVYSRSLWWVIWSPTQEMTYAGYALPRIQALSGRAWVAIAVVGFWWAIQHSFLPFIPDWRSFIWALSGLYSWRHRHHPYLPAAPPPCAANSGTLADGCGGDVEDHAVVRSRDTFSTATIFSPTVGRFV
jgi:uncharacterized protein